VVRPRHAAVKLLLAGLAHAGAAAGGRFMPEALNFVTDLLADAAQGAQKLIKVQHVVSAQSMGAYPSLPRSGHLLLLIIRQPQKHALLRFRDSRQHTGAAAAEGSRRPHGRR
jgi:hypothetical protein